MEFVNSEVRSLYVCVSEGLYTVWMRRQGAPE